MISFCVFSDKGFWVTNWYEYNSPLDINWDKVREFYPTQDIGYMVGKGSSKSLTSERNRVVLSGPGRVYFAPVADGVYNVYRVVGDQAVRIANNNGLCKGEIAFTFAGDYEVAFPNQVRLT